MVRPIPDPYERTVLVPIKIVDGVPRPLYGGTWPSIMEGTIGDLVLPAWAFEKPQDATLLSVPLTVPILRVGERLLVGLKPTAHSREVRRPGPDLRILVPFEGFAEIHLAEELRLKLRGTKRATLEPCDCWIPALGKTVKSLNEAYTILSVRYERHRRSHTGNVFQLVFFRTMGRSREHEWEPLESVRQRMESKLEARFQMPNASNQEQ